MKKQARPRKVPMRKCVVSQEKWPKKDLIRVVRTPEGQVEIDPTGRKNGRGAYVAMQPELVQKAKEKDLLAKHLEVAVDPAFYDDLHAYVAHQKARSELEHV